MIYVIDASVAVKWFIDEEDHSRALNLMASDAELIAPEIVLAEVAHVLRRKVRSKYISQNQASEAVKALRTSLKRLVHTESLIDGAFDLSDRLDHSIYDCLYLQCARQELNAHLITADRKFLTKASSDFSGFVVGLNDVPIELAFTKSQLKDLLHLYERSEATMENVAKSVRKPFGDTPGLIDASDMSPAYDSPLYVRLRRQISKLTSHQAATLIATAWYGRQYDQLSFEEHYAASAHLAHEPASHTAYIIGLLQYIENGIIRLRSDGALSGKQENDNG